MFTFTYKFILDTLSSYKQSILITIFTFILSYNVQVSFINSVSLTRSTECTVDHHFRAHVPRCLSIIVHDIVFISSGDQNDYIESWLAHMPVEPIEYKVFKQSYLWAILPISPSIYIFKYTDSSVSPTSHGDQLKNSWNMQQHVTRA